MDKKELLKARITEFLEAAKDDEQKKRINAATTMYFKALVEVCDYLLYNKILKLPENHTERYQMLEKFFPELYKITSPLFRIYRKTYSQVIEEGDLGEIKNGIKKVMEYPEVQREMQTPVKK
ncbi:hypothetical protein HZA99_05420 [Candidatus Woesearchaeota archaeon]|nr:hypothetical protein [Candidatus Woesearchaeota archaeon]